MPRSAGGGDANLVIAELVSVPQSVDLVTAPVVEESPTRQDAIEMRSQNLSSGTNSGDQIGKDTFHDVVVDNPVGVEEAKNDDSMPSRNADNCLKNHLQTEGTPTDVLPPRPNTPARNQALSKTTASRVKFGVIKSIFMLVIPLWCVMFSTNAKMSIMWVEFYS